MVGSGSFGKRPLMVDIRHEPDAANLHHPGLWLITLYISGLEPGFWVAPGCHRSRSLATAADDLLFLRALPKSATTNRGSLHPIAF